MKVEGDVAGLHGTRLPLQTKSPPYHTAYYCFNEQVDFVLAGLLPVCAGHKLEFHCGTTLFLIIIIIVSHHIYIYISIYLYYPVIYIIAGGSGYPDRRPRT